MTVCTTLLGLMFSLDQLCAYVMNRAPRTTGRVEAGMILCDRCMAIQVPHLRAAEVTKHKQPV